MLVFILIILSILALDANEIKALSALKSEWNSTVPKDWLSPNIGCEWTGITCDNIEHVISINLAGYGLRGNIPSEISLLTYCQELHLGFNITTNKVNYLTGAIPHSIGNMTKLTILDMSLNLI